MKKTLIFIVLCLFCIGCGKKDVKMSVDIGNENKEVTESKVVTENEDIIKAKAVVNKYYEFYKEKNTDAVRAMIDSELIEKVGGMDKANKMTMSRMNLIGEVTSYEIKNYKEKKQEGKTAVLIETEVTYSTGQITKEGFAVSDEKIVDLKLPNEEYTKMLIEDYFSQYGDIEKMKKCFLPYVISNFDMGNFEKRVNIFSDLCGEYVDFEVIKGGYLYKEFPEQELICLYEGSEIKANFENMSLVGEVQISMQDGNVGINFVDMYPEPIVTFYDNYINMIKNDDVDGMMSLYSDMYYKQINQTEETWRPNVEYMTNGMGDIKGYKIIDWNYNEQLLSDGSTMNIFGFVTNVYYDDKVYKEQMIFNFDESTPLIQQYKIEKMK